MVRVTSPTTRFTAAEFERMAKAGLFDGRRVELINGRIYRVAPQNDPHMTAISKINRVFSRCVPDHERLLCQCTLRLDANTTVDPDFIWLATSVDTPYQRWPMPLLIIEISDSTLRIDTGIKLRKYAKAGISDYWIINLPAGRIEVYRSPVNPTGQLADCKFRSVLHHERGETISPLARPDVTLSVDDLLP